MHALVCVLMWPLSCSVSFSESESLTDLGVTNQPRLAGQRAQRSSYLCCPSAESAVKEAMPSFLLWC